MIHDHIAAYEASSSQENLDNKAIVAHRGLRALELWIVEAKILAMSAGITISSSKEIDEGIRVSPNEIDKPVSTAIVTGVSKFVATSSWMADQEFKKKKGKFEEQVEQRACDY